MRLDNLIDNKVFRSKSRHYSVIETVDGRFIINHARHGTFELDEDEFQEFLANNPESKADPTPLMLTPIK